MKNILSNFLLINLLIFVVSCSTSNEVSQSSRIQKRRYTNGFYFSSFHKNQKKHSYNNEVVENELKNKDEYFYSSENTFASTDEHLVFQESKKNIMSIAKSQNEVVQPIQNSNRLNKTNIETNKEKKLIQKTVKWKKEELFNNFDYKQVKGFKTQESRKLNDEQIIFILLMILAFILPPLSVLLFTNIDWKKVLIATLLTCLWWGPGVIYAILVLLEIL